MGPGGKKLNLVVRVESRFEGEDGDEESREHGDGVQQLQLLLALAAEQSVDQSA